MIMLIAVLTVLIGILSCGKNTKLTNPTPSDTVGLAFGTDNTFDVITWNIENFPKADSRTIETLAPLIPALRVECLALQEITSESDLRSLITLLPGWSYRIANNSFDTKAAFIYNTATVSVDSSFSLFSGDSTPFPRPPLLMKIRWRNQPVTLISWHLKAYDDNVIDSTDVHDNEYRRLLACRKMDQYIADTRAQERVIVLGDCNDSIIDSASSNVFTAFLSQPLEYRFVDLPLVQNHIYPNFTYPSSSSNIDHILVTNELFQPFTDGGSIVRTIQMENYVTGGWSAYDAYISDHRPVGARFRFSR
jgi:hypothetical protein